MRRPIEWAVVVLLIACLCAYSGSEDQRVAQLRRELRQTMERMGRESEPVEIEQPEPGQDCPGLTVRMVSPRSAGLTRLIEFLAARQGCRIVRVAGPPPSSLADVLTQKVQTQGQRQLDAVFGPGRAVVVVHCRFMPNPEQPASMLLVPGQPVTYCTLPLEFAQSINPYARHNASSLQIDQLSAWLLLDVPRQRDILPPTLGMLRGSLGVDESRGDSVHYLPLP